MKTRKDAASYLGIHVATLDRWVRAGKLKRTKVPGRWHTWFAVKDLDRMKPHA